MPNRTPDEWTAPAPAVAPWPGPGGGSCANITCVHVDRRTDGVHVTSTIPDNDGRVIFTQDEWNQFLPDVKAGRWDHTVTGVPASA
jgi:hypothetical protein